MNRQEELYHHGILGQKWGVRRYQNSDGTLTSAGKRHYARELTKAHNKNVYSNYYANYAKENIDRFSKGKGIVSKLLVKTNTWDLKQMQANSSKSKAHWEKLVNEIKDSGALLAIHEPSGRIEILDGYKELNQRAHTKKPITRKDIS